MEPATTPAGTDATPVAGRIRPEFSVPFEQAVETLCDDMRLRELSDRHIANVRNMALKAGRDAGWGRVDDMTTDSITELLRDQKARGVAPKTRNEYRSILHSLASFAVKREWLSTNPARDTPRAKVVKRQARIVPAVDDVRRLIEAARGDWRKRDRWLVYLAAATTGLRWGQLKGLEWAHARLFEDPPHLRLPARLCKNGDPAVVWLTAELAHHLRAARVVEWAYTPNRGDVPPERVFRAVPKRDSFLRDIAAAGLDRGGGDAGTLSFHSLRHFASNRMDWIGFTTRERQRQNQHKTEAMTARTYTDPEHFELGRKVAQMPGLLQIDAVAAGKNVPDPLTCTTKILDTAPVTMSATPTQLDTKAPAPADSGMVTHERVTRAAASAPRDQGVRFSQSGRQDSNHAPRFEGAYPEDEAAGRSASPRTEHDPVTLALAEGVRALARLSAERSRSHGRDSE